MTEAVLKIENLSASLGDGTPILQNVSLSVEPGEVRALVGESGAGKSMIGKAVLGILPPSFRITSGTVTLAGQNLADLSANKRRDFVALSASLIPQDPLTALNPVRPVRAQVLKALIRIHGWKRADAETRLLELLDQVMIRNPRRVLDSYPHELSGGMRQRVLIAAAFANRPRLIVADEPTTALDVTVQKEILRIIRRLQRETGTAVLFVTHDMGVVAQISQNMTVLYGGRVLQDSATADVFTRTGENHPYTGALIAATPDYAATDGRFHPVPTDIIAALSRSEP